ncbi:MAG: FecR family protein [Elusimicrobia bacterium]|nr:FecR family protein [Elusimicrobiota bacterium]
MRIFLITALLALPAAMNAAETACIYQLQGSVEVRKAGEEDWLKAVKGLPLRQGDSLRTGGRSWCEMLLRDGTFIRLDQNSETGAEELRADDEGRAFGFSFLKGRAVWLVAKLKGKVLSRFTVRTPSAVCAVRGTEFAVSVSTDGASQVGLFEGKVALTSGAAEKELVPGQEAALSRGEVAVAARLSRLMKAEEKRCAALRGRVEKLRARLAARQDFLDSYAESQRARIEDFEKRRAEKLKARQ